MASLLSFNPEDLSWFTSSPNYPVKNLIGTTGAYTAGAFLFVFGLSSYALVMYLFFWSWRKFTGKDIRWTWGKTMSLIILFCVISSFIGISGAAEVSSKFQRAGIAGMVLSDFLLRNFDYTGSVMILLTLGTLAVILSGEFLLSPFVISFAGWVKGLLNKDADAQPAKKMPIVAALKPKINIGMNKKSEEAEKENKKVKMPLFGFKKEQKSAKPISPEPAAAKPAVSEKPAIRIAQKNNNEKKPDMQPATDAAADKNVLVGSYRVPPLDLLDDSPKISTSKIEDALVIGAKHLEETLSSFDVQAKVVDIERGPAITRYELQPAPGVKVQKFTTLANDIALAMKAPTVRIVAPIPGKSRVGIEVPNDASAAVFLKDVLSSQEFSSAKSKLTLSLGKDISGQAMVANLAEMPHLLIAGTTGSGKTVCVNGIIMSILLNATPEEVRFVMVDPKMVELMQYNDIPHLLCPTVTDTKKAANVLNWVVGEMENRYKILSKEGVRNIQSYHERGLKMPYIVVIIDELADLMQVSAKTVESSITRLAQLSRAVGIHLILATQRPSVNVITGVIKANFPARISFKVASKIDSRTVLDMNGAETLLGKGDMLFMKPGDAKPTRGQGNFVKDQEINRVIQFIKDQQAPIYDESILTQQTTATAGGSNEHDELYDEAVKLVVETNQASVSILQRRMRLGYTRAARLIDMMEQKGVVGPYVGSKARDILVDREQWLLENMGNQDEAPREG